MNIAKPERETQNRVIALFRSTCLEQGYPAPRFSYESSGLWVEFPFPDVAPAKVVGSKGDGLGGLSKASVKTSVKTSVKILQLLGDHSEMTLAQVAVEVGKTLRAVELASSKLVKAGRL